MVEFLLANGGTILVIVILLAVVALILLHMKKDRKAGKSSCGCKCSHCPNAGACHKEAHSKC
jgi:preprotein translocase subunit SecG